MLFPVPILGWVILSVGVGLAFASALAGALRRLPAASAGVVVGLICCGLWMPANAVFRFQQPPELRPEILGADIYDLARPAVGTGVVLDTRIANSGSPSIGKDWSLVVKFNDGSQAVARFVRLGALPELVLHGPEGDSIIPGSDSLSDKVDNVPISQTVRGRLLFWVIGVPKPLVSQPDTMLSLSVSDRNGHVYSTTASVRAISENTSDE
jgi:hypothetical protein